MYVLEQVRMICDRDGCSHAYLVLTALQKIGVKVHSEDLRKERRRERPTGTRQHYAMTA